MAKNALPLLLVGGGALLVAAKSKKKKRKASTKIEPKPAEPEEKEPVPDEPAPGGMANPAAVFCEEQGGKYVIRKSPKGESGVCVMPDGSEVPEWPFTRGEMAPGPAVDGLEAQGQVVMSKAGQAVTISFMEDPPSTAGVALWQMASDTELKPERVLTDKIEGMLATEPYRRYFTFFMDKAMRGRAIFELVKPRGEVVQEVVVSIEATEG